MDNHIEYISPIVKECQADIEFIFVNQNSTDGNIMYMTTNLTMSQAVSKRIRDLLEKQNITLYRLAQKSGVIYNTLRAVVASKNKSVDMAIVAQVAWGFGLSLIEFIDDPVFKEENLDI